MNKTVENNNEYFHEENEMENGDKINEEEVKITDRSNDIKNITLYRNGDKFFPPKRFVVNKRYIRTWDAFLEELTKSIQPRSGAIRDIRTPFHGTRIRSLDDLTINGKYVAVPKGEAMKLIDYTNIIDITSPLQQTKRDLNRLKPLKTSINHDMDKVESKINQQQLAKRIVINVYRNGDPFTRAIKIVLNHFEQKHMSVLVHAIEERVLLPSNKPIRRLYTMSGDIIRYAKDVEDGQFYVASANEPLYNIKYGQYLPVIRGGKIHSSYNKVKFLNHSSTPVTHRLNTEGNSNNEATTRSERSGYNSDRKQKPFNNKQQRKTGNTANVEAENSAIKIQAAFRGYSIRNEIHNAQENNTLMPKTKYKYIPNKDKPNKESQYRKDKNPSKTLNDSSTKRKEDNMKQKDQINSKEKRNVTENNSSKTKQNNSIKQKPKQEEKKNEINHSHSDKEHLAAAKIQAGFRSYLVRRQFITNSVETKQKINNNIIKEDNNTIKKIENIKNNEDNTENYDNSNKELQSAIKIQSGFRAYKTRSGLNQSSNNVQEEAAIKIQYGYRAYQTREQIKTLHNEKMKEIGEKTAEQQSVERNNAVTTIQAGFRSFKARKELER